MKLAIVVGTRPEIIKMSPVIKAAIERGHQVCLIHSNQHYTANMDQVFFDELDLPTPHYNLNVGSGPHSNQTGNILIKIEPIFEKERPQRVLVQGDTNTVLAAALAASKQNIPVAHVEAGLRSYDRTMPEETNRVVTDHISDYLFAVTKIQERILLQEGLSAKKIHVVGNTIADSCLQNIELAKVKSKILEHHQLKKKKYTLFTAHRASNVDDPEHLKQTVNLLNLISTLDPNPIIWPIHPRTLKQLKQHDLGPKGLVVLIDPVGHLDFLWLEKNANLIITDSGGVQEEACILQTPCITIRENTERPETVELGANRLTGRDPEKLRQALLHFEKNRGEWDNPFGDGTTGKKIVQIIEKVEEKRVSKQVPQKVTVVGLGYMGLPTACLLAKNGHQVTGVDINEQRIEEIQKGLCPFDEEPGLSDLMNEAMKTDRLKLSSKITSSDIFLIAVGTPHIGGRANLKALRQATEAITPHLKEGSLVIIESTIPPATCDQLIWPILKRSGRGVGLAHCPERAIPGNTLNEIVGNSRIIGASSDHWAQTAKELYLSFVEGEIHTTDLKSAETVKLMENTFRDVNIALANEVDNIAHFHHLNTQELIKLANLHPRVNYLSPGPGVGGHCIPIDPWFLIQDYPQAQLIPIARKINDERIETMVERGPKVLKLAAPSRIACLGVSYKPNTGDTRESCALKIMERLEQKGFQVAYHDPFVDVEFQCSYRRFEDLSQILDWCHGLIVTTSHAPYQMLEARPSGKPIFYCDQSYHIESVE